MGLDAHVNCNCYETGKLRELPPQPEFLRVREDGGLDWDNPDWGRVKNLGSNDPDWQAAIAKDIAFDRWLSERACEHEDGILVHHRIGNAGLVGELQKELSREAHMFPIIL